MKRRSVFKILMLIAAVVILLPVICSRGAAMTLQEQSWLSLLRPSLPSIQGDKSYPAKLSVQLQGFDPVELEGTCSLTGGISDEMILDALKKACSSVEGYKSPDDATADQRIASELKNKLKFTSEDRERILKNILSIVGKDKLYDIVRGRLPGLDAGDGISAFADAVMDLGEELDIDIPGSDSAGLIVAGAVVSWKEYERDRQKYKDIVTLSNANGRLREYYYAVNNILAGRAAENMKWVIKISDRVRKEELFDSANGVKAPYIYTAGIELTKAAGDRGTPAGTYSGSFRLVVSADLSDYDANFHRYLAKSMREKGKNQAGGSINWQGESITVNRPSCSDTSFYGQNVSVNVSLPYGVNRSLIELPLNPGALEFSHKFLIDMVYTVGVRENYGSNVVTYTHIEDSETGTSYLKSYAVVTDAAGKKTVTEDVDDGEYPSFDPRQMIGMTLTVDMVGR